MRKCLLFILVSIQLFGQSHNPISFGNNDTSISNTSDLFNSNIYISSNGVLQICAFGGGIVWKNNTDEKIEQKDSIGHKKYSKIYKETTGNKSWLISENRVDIYQSDKLISTKKIDFNSFTNTYFKNNSLYYVDFSNHSINKYDGTRIEVLKKFNQKEINCQVFFNAKENSIYFVVFFQNEFSVYKESNNQIILITNIVEDYFYDLEMIHIPSSNLFYFAKPNKNNQLDLLKYDSGKVSKIAEIPYHTRFYEKYLLVNKDYGIYDLCEIKKDKIVKIISVNIKEGIRNFQYDAVTNALYIGTNNKPIRTFIHLKNYPKLFHKINSSSIYSLAEDHLGRIYAGSYQGGIAVIKNDEATEINLKKYFPINGSFKIRDKMYFFDLSNMIELNQKGSVAITLEKHQGYFGYVSNDKKNVYLGLTQENGLYKANTNSVYQNKANWIKIDKKKGFNFDKIYTITEDTQNRIWCGSPDEGIGIYNPVSNTTKFIKSAQIKNFGPISSLTDAKGGLWFGGYDSNLIYFDGTKKSINTTDFIKIAHPLLEGKNRIMSLCTYKNWLIIGAYDKVLLLDLNEYYTHKKTKIRYLNPSETNFTSFIEQNTMLLAKDQSIWFSTSDNLYQWDIKKWLSLPTFKVTPRILIKKDSTETTFPSNSAIDLKPTQNSVDIQIQYQTRDNMPRFINGVLMKKGEKPLFDQPNLQTKFQFKNLTPGNYVFYVRVCQQDGSVDVFEYPIAIDSFLWQKWWFWLLVSLPIFAVLIYFFQKRNEIEKQKKKLSQLNLSSLSNQFRPHFMLNALNSIGSQLHGKPHAEKVISRLGESINILYGFTQKNEFTIAFSSEWKLVKNSIEIQRLLFMPNLKVVLHNENLIPLDYKIPVGLLQIPIENALLHGLRNKQEGNCLLEIDFNENETHFFITITDNGVGRENAIKINNFKKNGNGLKTILEMISIINQHQRNAIIFEIIDLAAPDGTIVKIALNKYIDYDKIKI